MRNLITAFLSFATFLSVAQTTYIVDNTPGRPTGPHIFSTLTEAITAATTGDIIQIVPSEVNYGNLTIPAGKNGITIYGGGINPDRETNVQSTISIATITSNDIRMGGLVFSSELRNNGSNNIFENCLFGSNAYASYTVATDGVFFRNCVFYFPFLNSSSAVANNVVINNSIFCYNSVTTLGQVVATNGTIINNCLFFGAASNRAAFASLSNSIINNSIFYGRSPSIATSNNSTFNNCYAENTANNNAFPDGSGTNTLNNIIPFTGTSWFADSRIVPAQVWNMIWDATLNPAFTELINGGNDGTDVGLTGGTIPWSKTASSLPYIKSILMPSIIRQGDPLNVTFDAKGN